MKIIINIMKRIELHAFHKVLTSTFCDYILITRHCHGSEGVKVKTQYITNNLHKKNSEHINKNKLSGNPEMQSSTGTTSITHAPQS